MTEFQKLPTCAKPTIYKINLTPDLVKFTFKGQVSIDLQILSSTSELVLNGAELEVESAEVNGSKGIVTLDKAQERITVSLPAPLQPGNANLTIRYTGTLNDKMRGFYRSKYTLNGVDKYMATCQFESTYARLAFPCWDEPAYKAVFDVVLNAPKGMVALSNMDLQKEESGEEGLQKFTYNRSPEMSTYLVAFIVGEFDFIETKTTTGVTVRVYTLPGKSKQGAFALECGKKALEFYDGFFGVKYPLPKSDLIAIPDFAMGAMENWGLVTYREVYLLVDETQSSQAARCHIALIVGHELAHMWFGNLATMKWWTDLWLKEGFATFMEYCFVADAYPQFNIWMQFANDEIARAFSLDALKSSHPIEVPIANPNELEEIYDAVSYAKSASVIGMLHAYLGEETFKKATSAYLTKFSFKNAETMDLWAAFSEASSQNIPELMSTWTKKMGFPLVTASMETTGTTRKLTLKQSRFLADGSADTEGAVWSIPINICTKSKPNEAVHKIILKEKEQTFTLEGVAEGDWIKLNAGMRGYYRVEYSADMLKPILEAVSSKALGPLDRFNLVTDVFALVRAGRASAPVFLDLLLAASAGGEDNYNVWVELDGGVGALLNVLYRKEELLPKFKEMVKKAYEPIGTKLGWEAKEGEGFQTARLRSLILNRLAVADDAATVAAIKALFEKHTKENVALNADLRSMIFANIGRKEGREGFEALKKLYEVSAFSEVQRACLASMACSKDPAVHMDAVKYGVEKVRPGDLYMVFMSAVASKEGQESCWSYVRENFDKLAELFGGHNSQLFQAIVKMSTGRHASEEKAKEVEVIEAYFAGRGSELKALERPVAQSVESIRLNAALLNRNADPLKDWLADH